MAHIPYITVFVGKSVINSTNKYHLSNKKCHFSNKNLRYSLHCAIVFSSFDWVMVLSAQNIRPIDS